MLIALYLLTGALTGLMAGLFGIGGGLVIVPALLLLLTFSDFSSDQNLIVHTVIGSSLAVIIFTAAASAWQHSRQNAVRWSDTAWLTPGLILGALMGAWIADQLEGRVLSIAIGLFSMVTAVQMWLDVRPKAEVRIDGRQLLPAGTLIGTASTLFGIGGGSMTVPLLHWAGRGMHSSVGTSAVCTLPVALTGTLAFSWHGMGTTTADWSTGYVYWPAVAAISLTSIPAARMGACIASRLEADHLRLIFAGYLVAVGIYLTLHGILMH